MNYELAMSRILKGSEMNLWSWQIFYIEAKPILLIPEFKKIKAKQTLLITKTKKIEAMRTLLISEIRKIEYRMRRSSVGSASACCKAGPSSNLGSASHGGSPCWAKTRWRLKKKGLGEWWRMNGVCLYCMNECKKNNNKFQKKDWRETNSAYSRNY